MTSLWQRIQRVFSAQAHAAVDAAEAPAAMLDQLQRELVEATTRARVALNRAMAWRADVAARAERERLACARLSDAARDALAAGNEEIGRTAVQEKQRRQHAGERLEEQLDKADEVVAVQRRQVDQLRARLRELKAKRGALMQRLRFTDALGEMSRPGAIPEDTAEVMARIEETINDREAAASVSAADGIEDDDARTVDSFITQRAVDAEVAAIKAALRKEAGSPGQ